MNPDAALPVLIVDGYNVIGQVGSLRALFEKDVHSARARLVDEVASYAAGRFEATVVFDGQGNPSSDGTPHEIAGVTVVFSPAGVEADAVIEHAALTMANRGREVVVATSDTATRDAVERPGIRVESGRAFESAAAAAALAAAGRVDGRVRARVEDLVDDETRARLMRWARGE